MKKTTLILALLISAFAVNAKTLIAYYSFTNNIHSIATELQQQTDADIVRIEPAEKGLDYAANNYAIGSALISAIRNHPEDAASYPAIDPVSVNLDDYDMVIVATPLWWSNMAAPMQTFLFQNGAKMAGKKIGLIVSSASSGISGVEADAKRLIPDGDFVSPSLWIRSSQTSSCRSMIENWLSQIDYTSISTPMAQNKINIVVNGHDLTATLNGNSSSQALMELISKGPVTIDAHEYGGFEMVGSLPESLPRNDTQTTTKPGDLILYLGNSICFYYEANSWDFTPLGSIDNAASLDLRSIFGVESGNAQFVLSLPGSAGIADISDNNPAEIIAIHTPDGREVTDKDITVLARGLYIVTYRMNDGAVTSRKIRV